MGHDKQMSPRFRAAKARGISFDFGHVLVGLDFEELAKRLHALCSNVSPEALKRAVPDAYHAHDEAIARGVGHEQGWRELVRVLVHAGCPDAKPADLDRTVEELWRMQPSRNLWREIPHEAIALLDRLSQANVPMIITSNSEGHLPELIAELGIAKYFKTILDSGQLGVSKPDPKIFELAAQELGVSMVEMAHVGDSESADIVGASEAGALAIRFDGFVPGREKERTVADARATNYEELWELLAQVLGIDEKVKT